MSQESGAELWQRCQGEAAIAPLRGKLLRLVESQAQIATLQLVDTLAEQALLEELLETSKPRLPQADPALHYLLRTPFRYPPLRWGSRFGRRHEPSLFYAALRLETALAEGAYYRFVLWAGMSSPPPSARILSEHTSFEVRFQVRRGVRLHLPPFAAHAQRLEDRQDYSLTQGLGSAMRAAGVEAFEYRSARCPQGGLNVALYAPSAFAERNPRNLQSWLCETTADYVAYKRAQVPDAPQLFARETFLQAGRLPFPA